MVLGPGFGLMGLVLVSDLGLDGLELDLGMALYVCSSVLALTLWVWSLFLSRT